MNVDLNLSLQVPKAWVEFVKQATSEEGLEVELDDVLELLEAKGTELQDVTFTFKVNKLST